MSFVIGAVLVIAYGTLLATPLPRKAGPDKFCGFCGGLSDFSAVNCRDCDRLLVLSKPKRPRPDRVEPVKPSELPEWNPGEAA